MSSPLLAKGGVVLFGRNKEKIWTLLTHPRRVLHPVSRRGPGEPCPPAWPPRHVLATWSLDGMPCFQAVDLKWPGGRVTSPLVPSARHPLVVPATDTSVCPNGACPAGLRYYHDRLPWVQTNLGRSRPFLGRGNGSSGRHACGVSASLRSFVAGMRGGCRDLHPFFPKSTSASGRDSLRCFYL